MRKSVIAVTVLALVLVTDAAWAQRCEHERAIDISVAVDSADAAFISAGAGSLLVEGVEGDRVTVTGRACASSAEALEQIDVRAARDGDRVRVEAEVSERRGWTGRQYAYADLEIRVPAGFAVEVEDGSGDAVVRNVGSAEISDGSGELEVSDIGGEVRITDGSGELEVRAIGGEVRITDGSGEMTVRGAGSVIVESDGSGGIRIEDVRGDVIIDSDGSGGIAVADVGGDFTVRSDGSGGIRHDNVAGKVSVPRRR